MNVNAVVIVGLGRMGRGIAQAFAKASRPVTLLDLKERTNESFGRLAEQVRAEIVRGLNWHASRAARAPVDSRQSQTLISIKPAGEAAESLSGAEFVFEGVPETQEAKRAVLAQVSTLTKPETAIASTTSTFLVTELQQWVTRPERFLNAHFLNPADVIPLVELSAGPGTSSTVLRRTRTLLESVGKVPVLCSASPGYIVPRLQALLMSEACRMVAERVASPQDIDRAIRYGFGPRYASVGVLEFVDWGGLDVLYYAGHYLAKALGSPAHAPPADVDRMMADGRRGLRERRGYYDWSGVDTAAWQERKLEALARHLDIAGEP